MPAGRFFSWRISRRPYMQRDAHLRLEQRFGGLLALETQRLDRRGGHVLQHRGKKIAHLRVAAAHGQGDAVGPRARGAPLEAVFALGELEARSAGEAVQAPDLSGELV